MSDNDLEFLGICKSHGEMHAYPLAERRRTLCGFSWSHDSDLVDDDVRVCPECFRAMISLVNASTTMVKVARVLRPDAQGPEKDWPMSGVQEMDQRIEDEQRLGEVVAELRAEVERLRERDAQWEAAMRAACEHLADHGFCKADHGLSDEANCEEYENQDGFDCARCIMVAYNAPEPLQPKGDRHGTV